MRKPATFTVQEDPGVTDARAMRALEWTMVIRSRAFAADERGAVSTEWVVLVAGVVMLCIAAFLAMQGGTMDVAQGTASQMSISRN